MDIDSELINKLKNTDDETLRILAKSIAASLGATEKQAAEAVNSVTPIKKRMANMSDEEIKKQINKQFSKIGEDKTNEILKQLKI